MTPKKEQDKPLPANVSAEAAIIGSILLDNSYLEAAAILDPEDFSLTSHGILWGRMTAMRDQGMAIDYVTLLEELRANGEYQELGETPAAYIASLTENLPRQPAVKEYVRIVKAKSLQRQLIGACESALKKSYAGESGHSIIASLRENLDEIESIAKRGMRTV
jgi:replicative DNA helicase